MQTDFRYADLMNDDVFKLVFGQESSKDVMIEFLNRVITDRIIIDLDFMDKEMKSLDRDRKDSVYDMFCKTDDGSRIIVEVQRRKQDTYIERSIYYSTFQIRNQVDSGSGDYAFCPVYVISILDFNIDENRGNPDVRTVYRLYEENRHNLLTDKLTLIYLELDKFRKTLEELDGDVLVGSPDHCPCLSSVEELAAGVVVCTTLPPPAECHFVSRSCCHQISSSVRCPAAIMCCLRCLRDLKRPPLAFL